MKDTDAVVRQIYERMRETGEPLASQDSEVGDRLKELGLVDPDSEAATEATVALIRALSAAHENLEGALRQQAVAMSLARHYLEAANPDSDVVSVELFPRADRLRLEMVLNEMAELIQHEVVSLHPAANWAPERHAQGERRSSKHAARGIRRRVVFHQRNLAGKEFREHVRKLIEVGEEVRFAPFVPTRMIAYDGRVALLQIDPADIDQGAILIRGSAAVTSLVALFEYVWLSASEAEDVPHSNVDLTEQQRIVLRMLATGAKDDVIARAMSVSTRTVARLVGELLTRLGATSRFQAGLRAAKLGWLD